MHVPVLNHELKFVSSSLDSIAYIFFIPTTRFKWIQKLNVSLSSETNIMITPTLIKLAVSFENIHTNQHYNITVPTFTPGIIYYDCFNPHWLSRLVNPLSCAQWEDSAANFLHSLLLAVLRPCSSRISTIPFHYLCNQWSALDSLENESDDQP